MASKNDDRAQQLLQLQQTVADAQLALAEALRALSQGQAVGVAPSPLSRDVPQEVSSYPHYGELKLTCDPESPQPYIEEITESGVNQLLLSEIPGRAALGQVKELSLKFNIRNPADIELLGTQREPELEQKLQAVVAFLVKNAEVQILGGAQCPW